MHVSPLYELGMAHLHVVAVLSLSIDSFLNLLIAGDPGVSTEHGPDELDVPRYQGHKVCQPSHGKTKLVKIVQSIVEDYCASYRWG